MEIKELSTREDLMEDGVDYFWSCWGSDTNYIFYRDCIMNSFESENALPKFYLCLIDNKIIGSYALLVNDIISRQDLVPWFACLHVDESHRNKGVADTLLKHGLSQAAEKGFKHLYLSSDLEGFYEKKGWKYLAEGYGVTGGDIKIYTKQTS